MLKIDTFFNNKITTPNIIFRDAENKGVNIAYFPELGSSGIDFINKYRKKNYWDYTVIPMAFMFLSHKVYPNNYYKAFKKAIPMVRIQRKFIKANNELKSIVLDLTPLSENFTALAKSRSKKQTMDAFFGIIEQFAVDNKITSKKMYLMVDNSHGDEKEMVDSLYYMARLGGNKIRIKDIEGILLYGARKFWPLTIKDQDKDGIFFKINMNILTRYMKEVHGEEPQEEIDPETSINITRENVKALYKVHRKKISSTASNLSGAAKKTDNIEENPLELIRNEVQSNKHIKGRSFEEKISNLFKDKTTGATDEKSTKFIKDISTEFRELNKQYNGTMELNENVVMKSRNSFYNPFNVIGFNDFHAYNKQDVEFGENLDQAIFDLIKSIETDKDLGIKIMNIKVDITDTNRDRYKTYKIKLHHKNFGHDKPYTVSFHVPIPSKGKYLKLGGNDWIMINQFFPKPVVKVAPEMVRIYTHYSTAAVFIKTHALNGDNDVKELIENFSNSLKRTKKLKEKPVPLTKEQAKYITDKYGLPEFINPDVFVNMEIK